MANDGGCLGLIIQLLSIFCGGKDDNNNNNNNNKPNQNQNWNQNQNQNQQHQNQQHAYPGQQQPQWNNNNNNNNNQHAYPPQQQGHQNQNQDQINASDGQYQQWRNEARREGDSAHKCFADSQTAYKSGDGGRAHDLSVQGKAHQAKQDALDDKAAAWIFQENNKTQPRGTIDLHGLFVKEAIEQVDKAIAEGQRSGAEELRVITGKGLHSARGQAKIKPAVEDLMRKYNLSAEVDPRNTGVLVVDLQGRSGGNRSRDAGGLVDQMKKDDNDCVIM